MPPSSFPTSRAMPATRLRPCASRACRSADTVSVAVTNDDEPIADNNRDKLFMPFGYGARERAIDAARPSRLDQSFRRRQRRRLPADIPGRLATRSGLEQLESGCGGKRKLAYDFRHLSFPWCPEEDSNLHGNPLAPEALAPAQSIHLVPAKLCSSVSVLSGARQPSRRLLCPEMASRTEKATRRSAKGARRERAHRKPNLPSPPFGRLGFRRALGRLFESGRHGLPN
jgi:hypothetical protein